MYYAILGPKTYPMLIEIKRNSPDVISISWKALTLEELRGFLEAYTLYVSESIYDCTVTKDDRMTETETDSIVLTDLTPHASYCMRIG